MTGERATSPPTTMLTDYENKMQSNSPQVLVAVPAKPGTHSALLAHSERIFNSLTYKHKTRGLYTGSIAPDPDRACWRQAQARNILLDECLQDHHTHILMMDADLVSAPADLIERLLAVSTTDIVAPHVWVEKRNKGRPASMQNGGWFYDTGAFIKDGQTRNMWVPDLPGLQEMDSVGCCYLLPASVWRKGARYEPVGHEIDHLSLMRQAKAMGYRIWSTSEVVVEHAYLPIYEEEWHAWPQ